MPSYDTVSCHEAEENLQVYEWVKNEKGKIKSVY